MISITFSFLHAHRNNIKKFTAPFPPIISRDQTKKESKRNTLVLLVYVRERRALLLESSRTHLKLQCRGSKPAAPSTASHPNCSPKIKKETKTNKPTLCSSIDQKQCTLSPFFSFILGRKTKWSSYLQATSKSGENGKKKQSTHMHMYHIRRVC